VGYGRLNAHSALLAAQASTVQRQYPKPATKIDIRVSVTESQLLLFAQAQPTPLAWYETVQVFDVMGKMHASWSAQSAHTQTKLLLAKTLQTGLYFVRGNLNGRPFTSRLWVP
jgi:hypothetical protein